MVTYQTREMKLERFIRSTRPVLWLPLYRKDGNSFISPDGYGHAVTNNGTWGLSGFQGNGSSTYLSVADNNVLDLTGEFTIIVEAQFADAGTGKGLVNRGNNNSLNSSVFDLRKTGSDTIRFTIANGSASEAILSSFAVVTNKLYHIAAVARTSQLDLYIDGQLANTSVTRTITPNIVAQPLIIGAMDNVPTGSINGIIKEMRLYAYGQSYTEIMSDFNALKRYA